MGFKSIPECLEIRLWIRLSLRQSAQVLRFAVAADRAAEECFGKRLWGCLIGFTVYFAALNQRKVDSART